MLGRLANKLVIKRLFDLQICLDFAERKWVNIQLTFHQEIKISAKLIFEIKTNDESRRTVN